MCTRWDVGVVVVVEGERLLVLRQNRRGGRGWAWSDGSDDEDVLLLSSAGTKVGTMDEGECGALAAEREAGANFDRRHPPPFDDLDDDDERLLDWWVPSSLPKGSSGRSTWWSGG